MSDDATDSAPVSTGCPPSNPPAVPVGKRRSGAPRGNGNARKHGISTLKRTVKLLGARVVDKRTKLGLALGAWRSDLIDDLGGVTAISTQEAAIIDAAVKTKLILDSVDAWLLKQPSLVSRRQRAVIPAVRDRN